MAEADSGYHPLTVPFLDAQAMAGDPELAAEAILATVESRFPVRVTIHDRSGVFQIASGIRFLRLERGSHQIPFCQTGRRPGDLRDRCLAHCQDAVNHRASADPGVFVHRCWKGGHEVVVPLWRHGTHLATCFAGVFRLDEDVAPTAWRHLVRHLPRLEPVQVMDLATALAVAGEALLATAERGKILDGHGERAGLIRRFLHYHAHRNIGLEDLARHLGLSPWHCSRVVARALGASFGDLLLEERLQRAAGLLRSTDHDAGTIARLVGFISQPHFCRAFKVRFGQPPGRWRRTPYEGTPEGSPLRRPG